MKKLIIVADWASDSISCQEFRTYIEGFSKEPDKLNQNYVVSTPSTIHAGYLSNQIIEIEERFGRPLKTLVFQNVDTHIPKKASDFVIIRLKSGLLICGPNAGNNFSFIKNKINEIFLYKKESLTTPYKTGDNFARICAHLIDELEDEMDLEEINPDAIPDLQGNYIGHIDNFGNIKTTIAHSEFKGKYEYHDWVEIFINKIKKKAKYVPSLFSGSVGELVIYPGSSGPNDDRYLEISVWRHFTESDPQTGKQEFGNPLPGIEIKILA